ncbi:MAG: ABC transporter substrate-binding protein [Acidimicrobiales bacterium]|nr:ABC transporter substrate-binding protein [Acidimicrobiales bacterium]
MVATACGGGDDGGGDGDGSTSGEDAGTPTPGGTVVYGLVAETTNGWCLQEGQLAIAGIQVARSIYDTLTVPDGDGNFVPFLAETISSNPTFTEWTIRLRSGVTFHDGSPLTAEVVKNNLDAYRGQYPARTSLLFIFVLQNIASTEVVDPLTVKVTTTAPWSSFPSFLYSSGRLGITGQAQLDDAQTCSSNLIGTGPFKLVEWRVNDRLLLERNEDYWRSDAEGNQLPYLDELEFRPVIEQQQRINGLRSGELDAFHTSTALTIDEMRALDEAEQVNLAESADNAEVAFLMPNSTTPPFDNQIARAAIANALLIELATEIQSKGIPQVANGPFAPGSLGYVEDTGMPRGDLATAEDLVAQYEAETGLPFEFQITSTPDPDTLASAQLAAQMFKDAGMDVSVTTLEQSSLISAAISKEFQLMTFRNDPGLDPDNNYVWWYGAGNPVNFPGFDDPDVNRLLDAGRATPDRAQRQEIYGELNRLLAERNYLLWSTWVRWAVPMQPDVHGVVGARPGGDSPDYTGLALGHDTAYLWKEQ